MTSKNPKPKTSKKPAGAKAAKSKATTKSKPASTALAMGALAEGYLAHLEEAGKSPGTLFSYKQDVQIAVNHFGADTDVATITPKMVAEYFESEGVLQTKTGRAKARPTVDKTRRVLRLALLWAANNGLIASAPIPEPAAKS